MLINGLEIGIITGLTVIIAIVIMKWVLIMEKSWGHSVLPKEETELDNIDVPIEYDERIEIRVTHYEDEEKWQFPYEVHKIHFDTHRTYGGLNDVECRFFRTRAEAMKRALEMVLECSEQKSGTLTIEWEWDRVTGEIKIIRGMGVESDVATCKIFKDSARI